MRIKVFFIAIFIFLAGITIIFSASKPHMHKPFQLNVIEYIMKINTDGSITKTKTTTTTQVK